MINLEKDVDNALTHYPLLKRKNTSSGLCVYGKIEILRENGSVIDDFEVQITFPKNYPYCFPKVIETSSKIPRIQDRHVNIHDGYTLCLAVRPEEKIICKNGIDFLFFLNNVLYQHLAREILVNLGEDYPNGEYAHGEAGIWQFFEKQFKTNNREFIIESIKLIVENKLPGRNDHCYCGTEKKYKKCHESNIISLSGLSINYLKEELNTITKNI